MTTALEGGEWSAAGPGHILPPGKTRYPLYRRLGGPQGRSGRAENITPMWFHPRTIQPIVSRYTDWATWPTTHWDPCNPVYYRYSTSTGCTVSPLCDVCVSSVISVTVTLSCNVLSVLLNVRHSPILNISLMLSLSVRCLLVAKLINPIPRNSAHNKLNT